jgi:hypothetical protein
MQVLTKGFFVAALLAAGAFAPAPAPYAAQTEGTVYDLDYIQNLNSCQVLIRDGFVGIARDVRIQQVLQTAMQLNAPVTVHYEGEQPKHVYRVVLKEPRPLGSIPDGLHRLTRIDFDETDGKCQVQFVTAGGKKALGFTRDLRLEALLVTALREGWQVGYLSIDETTREITRAKLNIEDQ